MKKLFFALTLTLTGMAFADDCPMKRMRHMHRMDPLDAMRAYTEMEKGHMDRWFDLKRHFNDTEIALIKKQHDEKADFHIHGLAMLKQHGFSDRLLDKKLHHMMKLHERQVEEWRRMFKARDKEAMRIYKQNKHEFEAFKESL